MLKIVRIKPSFQKRKLSQMCSWLGYTFVGLEVPANSSAGISSIVIAIGAENNQ